MEGKGKQILDHHPRNAMVPIKTHSVWNCRLHSLGRLFSTALDFLLNHNAHHKMKAIKQKKNSSHYQSPHTLTEQDQIELIVNGIARSKNTCNTQIKIFHFLPHK